MLLAEKLVGEARERHQRQMYRRERVVTGLSAFAFLAAAAAIALTVPNDREADALLVVGLAVGFVIAVRVRFEFAGHYGTAEQLAVVPMILLAPLPYVPLLIGVASLVAALPETLSGRWHRERVTGPLSDCWFCVPPVLVLAALAPGTPELGHAGVYLLAFVAQLAGDFSWSFLRNKLLDRLPTREHFSSWLGSARVDAIFTPVAFAITLAAASDTWLLLAIGPLAWLLQSFARDRQERYAKTLELHRAYRGTVMLLSDVVEFEDDYTASHSRSVVELVNAVADELGFDESARQELEFAAMLHDVGKIAIPKEILNKPGKLTPGEFEVMKSHTIEGQFMLDRVGGLLARVGEIVRSCHERWDGNGYPDGLRGEEIPYAARIVFCCDAYHAMTSDRVYRAARPKAEALQELVDNAGTQFDPRIVEALITVVETGVLASSGVEDVRAILAAAPLQPRAEAHAAS